ncbi:dynamin-related protein 4C-like [Lotus japonicus]|uniref:dynamin-related protein 4C-like n=1 Tax=Lotus japonicus TaxID=34305 RepID=UPI002589F3AA|nr:dynamin-related protein 4C-like [Lotus japonicus]
MASEKAASTANQREDSLALVLDEQPQPLAVVAPIVSSYNEKIRPVLDAVENLRRLNIAKEGIKLPTIVVVGDQSSGKSSGAFDYETTKPPSSKARTYFGVQWQNLSSIADAMTTFMHIVGLSKDSLRKILLTGDFGEFSEEKDKHMHCTARLVEMLDSCASDLHNCPASDPTKDFLMEEIKVLEEAKLIGLPNFMPRSAFLTILQRKVTAIADKPIDFVEKVWDYLETVVISVLMLHSGNYYQLQVSTRRAGKKVIAKKKENSIKHVLEAIEMEKHTDYTCNPEYSQEYDKLISRRDSFLNQVLDTTKNLSSIVWLEGVGVIDVGYLRDHPNILSQAFDLKVRMIAYWKIVQRRLIDCMALHLRMSIKDLVDHELENEICDDFMSPKDGGIERLLEESPSISGKREKLNRSVKVLRQSKETVANILDRIGSYGDNS